MSKRPDAERQPASVRVLIVDDYEPWRRWVYAQLASQRQFQVVGEASDGLEAVAKALNNGAQGYVLKGDANTELFAAVAAVLQGGRFVSSRLGMEFEDCGRE